MFRDGHHYRRGFHDLADVRERAVVKMLVSNKYEIRLLRDRNLVGIKVDDLAVPDHKTGMTQPVKLLDKVRHSFPPVTVRKASAGSCAGTGIGAASYSPVMVPAKCDDRQVIHLDWNDKPLI